MISFVNLDEVPNSPIFDVEVLLSVRQNCIYRQTRLASFLQKGLASVIKSWTVRPFYLHESPCRHGTHQGSHPVADNGCHHLIHLRLHHADDDVYCGGRLL